MSKISWAGRPIIGVTGPDEGGDPAWYCTRLGIWLAGGKAVRITPKRGYKIQSLAGVILGGGADIDPVRYKQELLQTIKTESQKVRRFNLNFVISIGVWLMRRFLSVKSSRGSLDTKRDELEFALLKECLEQNLPVLGICRGGQLINVYFGGSLHQSITSFYTETPKLRTIRPRKKILLENETHLAKILNRGQTKVNSLHDQAVRDLGKDLKVAAREPNGVIQAIEHTTYPFLLGVQWHPEFLPQYKRQRAIFKALVQASSLNT